jgi:hypothetical protein
MASFCASRAFKSNEKGAQSSGDVDLRTLSKPEMAVISGHTKSSQETDFTASIIC